MKIHEDSAQVKIPPPLFLVAAVAVGSALHFVWPLPLPNHFSRWIGFSFFLFLGISLVFRSIRLFKSAKTNVEPWKTTSAIITTGIYRQTRNPIYLSFLFVCIGMAFALNSIWILLMLAPLILAIRFYVIAKEERYLELKFGEEYRNYKSNVRRWI